MKTKLVCFCWSWRRTVEQFCVLLFRTLSSIPVPSLMRRRNRPKRMGKMRRMMKLKMRKMEMRRMVMKKMEMKRMRLSRVTRPRWSIHHLASCPQ